MDKSALRRLFLSPRHRAYLQDTVRLHDSERDKYCTNTIPSTVNCIAPIGGGRHVREVQYSHVEHRSWECIFKHEWVSERADAGLLPHIVSRRDCLPSPFPSPPFSPNIQHYVARLTCWLPETCGEVAEREVAERDRDRVRLVLDSISFSVRGYQRWRLRVRHKSGKKLYVQSAWCRIYIGNSLSMHYDRRWKRKGVGKKARERCRHCFLRWYGKKRPCKLEFAYEDVSDVAVALSMKKLAVHFDLSNNVLYGPMQ